MIKDYEEIIERVNLKLCTHFDLFETTTENVDSFFREIERINDELFDGKESIVSKPSPERIHLKNRISSEIPESLVEKANTLYERVCIESQPQRESEIGLKEGYI